MASVSNLLACANPYESRASAALWAPVRFLIAPMQWPNYGTVLLFGWGLLALLFVLIYLVLPHGFWNTNDGFKSAWVSAIFTILIFVGLTFAYVMLRRDAECEQLAKVKARAKAGLPQSTAGAGPALFSDIEIQDVVGKSQNAAKLLVSQYQKSPQLMGGLNVVGGSSQWRLVGHYPTA